MPSGLHKPMLQNINLNAFSFTDKKDESALPRALSSQSDRSNFYLSASIFQNDYPDHRPVQLRVPFRAHNDVVLPAHQRSEDYREMPA